MTAPHTSTEAGGPATALPSTEDLARLAKAIPAGPWLSVQNHPTNACAHVLQDADCAIEIATLYGNHDDVPAPSDGEPWADMPTRDATAEAIALLPALLREVLAHRKAEAWQPIETAPKDGTFIIAYTKSALKEQWMGMANRPFVVKHMGRTEVSGLDLGWSLFPGMGVGDDWLEGWMPLPTTPEAEGGRDAE